MTKLHEGSGHVYVGNEPHSLDRRWTSMAPTRENLAEQRGQTVDGVDTAEIAVAIALIVSWLQSMTGTTGEAPSKSEKIIRQVRLLIALHFGPEF